MKWTVRKLLDNWTSEMFLKRLASNNWTNFYGGSLLNTLKKKMWKISIENFFLLEDYDLFIRLSFEYTNVKTICWRNIFNNDDDTLERDTFIHIFTSFSQYSLNEYFNSLSLSRRKRANLFRDGQLWKK